MSDPTLTTQTTTSIDVAHAPPARFDELGAIEYVFGALFALVLFLGGLIVIINAVRGWRKDGEGEEEKRAKALIGPLATAVDGIVEQSKRFRTDTELDRDFGDLRRQAEQERSGRLTFQQAVEHRLAALDASDAALSREQVRLSTQQEGFIAEAGRLRSDFDRLGTRVEEKIDKFTAVMTAAMTKAD